jgi:hypothetical protein
MVEKNSENLTLTRLDSQSTHRTSRDGSTTFSMNSDQLQSQRRIPPSHSNKPTLEVEHGQSQLVKKVENGKMRTDYRCRYIPEAGPDLGRQCEFAATNDSSIFASDTGGMTFTNGLLQCLASLLLSLQSNVISILAFHVVCAAPAFRYIKREKATLESVAIP